jgi:ribosome-associated protein
MGSRAINAKRQTKGAAGPTSTAAREAVRKRTKVAQAAAQQLAIASARVMDDAKCEDIIIFDVRGVSTICDYLLIGTGTSDRQMRAVADHVEEMAEARGEKVFWVDGRKDGEWIVIDYVDVMIHLFESEKRAFYDLESMWGDCPRVEWAK